jgi:hypothetical protein
MASRSINSSSFYSYSAKRSLRQEEVAAYRRIAVATLLVVGLLVGGYFIGIPLIARMGADSVPQPQRNALGTSDNIPPSAPRLDGLPDVNRTRQLSISGSAESGAKISVLVNEREQLSTLADKSGKFDGKLSLSPGENSIVAIATDTSGNKSRPSKAVIVRYDATPPKLLIVEPGESVTTSTSASATISGKTDQSASVDVNGRQAIVQADGQFSISMPLSDGQNTITIKSTDAAGNARTITRTIIYNNPAQASSAASPDR